MSDIVVSIRDLHHTYLADTPLAAPALHGADLTLHRGELAALVGPGGAGKSTLVHFINGLLRPTAPGRIMVFEQDMAAAGVSLSALRRRVGLVFQYPHHQLFERYVGDDIAYGPRQLDLSRDEIRERVRWAMGVVGLDFETFVDRHTFSLSGGEMRRVALAGVLAMRPELLVLDEATSGLDPRGRAEVHALLRRLRDDEGVTVLIVSNDMDEVAGLADSVTVLYAGRTVLQGPTREVFSRPELADDYGLARPTAAEIVRALAAAGLPVEQGALTPTEAEEAIWRSMTR
jgi:energy-coupling factor transport system ATP-binding protein